MDKRPECLDKNGNMKREIIELIDSTIEEYKRQILNFRNNCLDYLNSPKNRTLIILSSLPISLVIFYLVRCLYQTKIDDHLVTSIILSPVLILLWKFRDQNTRHQIENSRKDINLKDFQQISLWASGEELKGKGNNVHPLQISSIYQLGSYFRGDYGKEFQRPAFEILKSILNNIQFYINIHKIEKSIEETYVDYERNNPSFFSIIHQDGFDLVANKLESTNTIRKVLFEAIFLNNSDTLRSNEFKDCLVKFNLSGFDKFDFIVKGQLDLSNMNFGGTIWDGARINDINFEGSNFAFAKFRFAKISDTNMNKTKMHITNFDKCLIENVTFEKSDINVTEMNSCKLKKVSFFLAKCERFNILKSIFEYGVNFKDCICNNTNFDSSLISSLEVSENTKFNNTKILRTAFESLDKSTLNKIKGE